MKWIAIALILGAGLTGCATHTRMTDEGSASYGEKRARDNQPAAEWSVRDFATPRGLFR